VKEVPMFLEVRRVEHVRGYVLRLEFNDGAIREVNLSDELEGEVFEPLRDPKFFSLVAVNPETGTIEWPNGADFAPEFLAHEAQDCRRVA
jgi:hypothetical protein